MQQAEFRPTPAHRSAVEFLRVELAPTIDGALFVRVDATSVEETSADQFELSEQTLGNEKVLSLEAALQVIGDHARRCL